MNSEEYKWGVNWATVLQHLIEDNQMRRGLEGDHDILRAWEAELDELWERLKVIFNPSFGSIFRARATSTFFSRRLHRVADVYTSRITNMNRCVCVCVCV